MAFDFCTKHLKRYEKGNSVCVGCYEDAIGSVRQAVSNIVAVRQESNAPVRQDESNGFDKKAYQREYMRKRRATSRGG